MLANDSQMIAGGRLVKDEQKNFACPSYPIGGVEFGLVVFVGKCPRHPAASHRYLDPSNRDRAGGPGVDRPGCTAKPLPSGSAVSAPTLEMPIPVG